MFADRVGQLLQALDAAHAAYYEANLFGGPSHYFHLHALQAGQSGDVDRFAESVYALLTAWGMHRMGRGGSKMCDFKPFRDSLEPLWPIILRLQERDHTHLNHHDWDQLKEIFRGIRCMATGTSLVGNTKVMAHALPKLVPPIDREYTLKYLFGTGHIANGIEREWAKFQTILRDFFYPVASSRSFQSRAGNWMEQVNKFRWDTSPIKIIDNLVIGIMKLRGTKMVTQ